MRALLIVVIILAPVFPWWFGTNYAIPGDNPQTGAGIALGRKLFYEPLLSKNNQISCATCHRQSLAFTDGQAVSPGVDGKATGRNAMSLSNLLWEKSFFWDGRVRSLEEQARFPMTNEHEMGQTLAVAAAKLQASAAYAPLFHAAFGESGITGDNIVKALAQFERTLISCDAPYDRYLQGAYVPTAQEQRGLALFGSKGCAHCHETPKTFANRFDNNGLDSLPADPGRAAVTGLAADRGRFKVPTLRNVALTAPYMHDGRFRTLEEVLDHYGDHLVKGAGLSAQLRDQPPLSAQDRRDIIAFLDMLTDATFIHNPQYAAP
ncbi:MAG TPA: cytochrome c peroxidase [Dinghuibacter sp.]|uniref:cytochrome-c peroxidase n=1 Tax=Dinghuibacter sp. TaxID=2024697 RepID=UPI002C54D38A|nr:cytochrome c peroxidase [Dinghuibacter sp.]HTJ11013.1 cytochrome c peroxidase [Dinghuibacter sp.]